MKLLFLILAIVCLLPACGKKDANYYMSHPEEFEKKIEECKGMSSVEKISDKECTAVSIVLSNKFFGDGVKKPGEGNGRGTKRF